MAPFSPIANPHISPLTCISSHWLFAFVILFANKVDTLCDRLAILVSGRVNAEGSPDRLKQQFGGGYKVSLRLKKIEHIEVHGHESEFEIEQYEQIVIQGELEACRWP